MRKILTPEQFLDLVLIVVYWQWNAKNSYHKRTITVDTVVRLLTGVGMLTKQQGGGLYKDPEMQDIFQKHIVLRHDRLDSKLKTLYYGGSGKYLIIRTPHGVSELDMRRVLLDKQLELSNEGWEYARSVLATPHALELGERGFMAFRASETKRFDEETETVKLPKGRLEKGRILRIDEYVEQVEEKLQAG